MSYFFSAIRSVYAQLTTADQYAGYSKSATIRRLLKKPAYLIQVAANKRFNATRRFKFNGTELNYFHHYYNNTSCNERTIEIPIAQHFVRPGVRTLEVGNVLNHYMPFEHDVVDRYEDYPGVLKEDILNFTAPRYNLIICISTLEHLGWDEPVKDPGKPLRAMEHLKEHLLAPDGTMVVTIPHGENPDLDSHIDKIRCSRHTRFQRYARFCDWREVEIINSRTKYGIPYPGANALHVLLFYGDRSQKAVERGQATLLRHDIVSRACKSNVRCS